MIVQSFSGFDAKKTFRAVYYFDKSGNAIKSSHFYRIRRYASYRYLYNNKGRLLEKSKTYDINNKNKKKEINTTRFTYEFDPIGRLIHKTTDSEGQKSEEYYQDFDNNNPQTIIYPSNGIKYVRKYNSLNQVILIQRIENDVIKNIEEIQYNEFGDKIYSNLPLYDINKIETITTGRYSAVETYEYIYDKSNRWIEKYVVFDSKRILLEKRFFK